jgi:acetyltransferase-like isoleucine patch superfamily enzyme
MDLSGAQTHYTHGDGQLRRERFARLGDGVIFEEGVLVFHPENIEIADNVYVGHRAVLKGYHRNRLVIGSHTWIGQDAFLHSAGGITVGAAVGIGPRVCVLTSQHVPDDARLDVPVLFCPLESAPVTLADGCDVGIGAIILPGVTIGEGAIIGAGAVVADDVPAFEVWGGVPARCLRTRRPRNQTGR